MSRVILDMSPSLDGYIAGAGVSAAEPFGDVGHRLHHWLGFESATPSAADREAAAQMFAGAGAIVIGRRMFDVGIDKWGDDGAFGRPCFVVTHRLQPDLVKGPTTFRFVTAGVLAAVAMARKTAGACDVVIAGGAQIAQQSLDAGLIDELRLHIVPVLLGRGVSLFSSAGERRELQMTQIVHSPNAAHVRYELRRV